MRRRSLVRGLIAASLLVLATSSSAEASCWLLIHCWGSQSVHSAGGTKPQLEFTANTAVQCHGVPGDQGDCNSSQQGTTFNVTCYTWLDPNPQGGYTEREFCTGGMTCPSSLGGASYGCGGRDWEVFTGTTDMNGNGLNTGFIRCIKPGQPEFRERCPDGVA